MAKGAVYLTESTDGDRAYQPSSRTDLKRSHPWALDDIETELSLNKKPAVEISNSGSTLGALNANSSISGNASICQTISSPLTDRLLGSGAETANQICSGNIPPANSGNSTTKSVVATEEDSAEDDSSFSLSSPQTKTKDSKSDFVKKTERKESQKVASKNFITNVKKLLATGLLEGVPVKYIFESRKIELSGVIKDNGYLCSCSVCNYSKVLDAYEFEQHAKCSSSHPNNHIFLENKKSMHVVVQELKGSPPELLDEAIQTALGSALINEKCYQDWKASQHLQTYEVGETTQESQFKLHNEPHSFVSSPKQAIEDGLGRTSSTRKQSLRIKQKVPMSQRNQKESKQTVEKPKVFASEPVVEQKDYTQGPAKKKDLGLHRLIFMPNGLPDGTELFYHGKEQFILKGYKQDSGIVCSCCNSLISPSQFEAHAGCSVRRQPYRHIYTANGLSLHDLSISMSNDQNLSITISSDQCAICGDGEELLHCDGCPRAFHKVCLELQFTPEGDWYCPYCKDKSGLGRNATSDGTSSGITRPIIIRLKRICKAPAREVGGCVLCRAHDFTLNEFNARTVMLCDQCEKEFHVGCLKDNGLCDLKELPKDKWFCCLDCSKIHAALQNLTINGAEIIPDSLSSMIKGKLEDELTREVKDDVQWQLLSGKIQSPENKLLLSKAAAIFGVSFR